MKKILITILLCLFASYAFAAGTVTPGDLVTHSPEMKSYVITCVADSADGTLPATAIDLTAVDGYYLYEIRTSPGGTAPTDASDFTLADANGLDVLGGAGTDGIDATSDLNFIPKKSDGGYFYPIIQNESLTLTITNNSVNSATFTIELVFVK